MLGDEQEWIGADGEPITVFVHRHDGDEPTVWLVKMWEVWESAKLGAVCADESAAREWVSEHLERFRGHRVALDGGGLGKKFDTVKVEEWPVRGGGDE